MKKLILFTLLAGGIARLHAQQKLPVKPADSLLSSLNKSFDLKPGNAFKLPLLQPNSTANLNALIASGFTGNTDHMPVAVLAGNSKMPVKKIGGYYTMPVKKIGGEAQVLIDPNHPNLPSPFKA